MRFVVETFFVDIMRMICHIDFNTVGIYLLKVYNRNTRTRCEICSKLTIKTSERRHWCRSNVFIVNFEYIPHLALVFLLLTLNMQLLAAKYGSIKFDKQR